MNEQWFFKGAGLILLHPFLSIFFKKIGLLDGNDFKDEAARHRAVHLLQYLQAGVMNAPEPDLVLPKFLCGLSFDVAVGEAADLTEAEQTNCNELLNTVLQTWEALSNSSPDALREGFLQRDGKLEKRGSGWYITVEKKNIDILMDRLPWNMNIIRLPWRAEPLLIEWG